MLDAPAIQFAATPADQTAAQPHDSIAAWLSARRVNVMNARLDDLIGLNAAKREIAGLAARLGQRDEIIAAGAGVTRGALMYGPPGSGKTSLARCLAAMLGPETAFYELSSAEMSAERIRALGDHLRATDEQAVVFLDEADFLLDRGSFIHTTETRSALFAALSVLDGLQPQDRSVWIAATNRGPTELDGAITRAGRLGIHIEVNPPTLPERVALFERFTATRSVAPNIDWRRAAELTGPTSTAADIIGCLDDALALAFADGLRMVDQPHLDEALRRFGKVIETTPLAGRARWQRVVHESGHALCSWLLGEPPSNLLIDGPNGGRCVQEADAPRPLNDIAARHAMRVAMAGRAATDLLLERGESSLGNYRDVDIATSAAMSRFHAGTLPGAPVLDMYKFTKPESPWLADQVAQAVSRAIEEERIEAEALLREHLVGLRAFASLVEPHDVLGGDEIRSLILQAGFARRDQQAAAITGKGSAVKAAPDYDD